MKKTKNFSKNLGLMFLITTLLLIGIGLLSIADASSPIAIRQYDDKFFFLKQQAISVGIGFVVMMVFYFLNLKILSRLSTYAFLASIVLLIAVLIPGLGVRSLGAKRWLDLGFIRFQPSEIAKFSLILYLAKVSEVKNKIIPYFFPVLVMSFLIMLEPDLGTTIVLVLIGMTQIFISGVGLLPIILASGAGILSAIILIITSDYRRERLLTFFERTRDPLGKAYHIRQILFALGAGGITGVGIGQSRQKYLFLPETATDSIFAVIAEETGFIGSLIIILIYIFLIYVGVKISLSAKSKYSQIVSIGIVSWIGFQAFLNISSMVALLPLTGITLPFISYGGSSIVTMMAGVGIILNIYKNDSDLKLINKINKKKKRR